MKLLKQLAFLFILCLIGEYISSILPFAFPAGIISMIILLILNFGSIFEVISQIFIWLSVALTIISLATYIMQNKKGIGFIDAFFIINK